MPGARRARQHARVAEVLEARAPASDARTQRLAFHYAQAAALGYADRAVRYLTEAARAADRSLAHEQAGAWFEQAASLATDPAERNRWRLCAAGCHLLGGDFARARTLAEGLAGAEDPRVRLEAAMTYEAASQAPRPARAPGGRVAHRRDERCPPRHRRPAPRAGVASLGRALAFTGATDQAAVLGRRAIELARTRGDDELLAHALQASLWHGLRPQDAPQKLARATELTGSPPHR